MKKIITVLTVLILTALSLENALACTSAIISGRLTPDGRPLLWKQRDCSCLENMVEWFQGEKYSFIGIINHNGDGSEVWMGTNETGFSIINTESTNMRESDEDGADQEGVVMCKALGVCRNLADFEKFLKANKPLGVNANFGVIDAEGGAAYYECNSRKFIKQDINDPQVAPLGYKVYTNFSPYGTQDGGGGYIRYQSANEILADAASRFQPIDPQWIFNNLARSFSNPVLGIDLVRNPQMTPEGWFYDMDFIPRRSTASSVVIKGVKPGENPLLTTMWAVIGYPPVSVAIPLSMAAGKNQPAVATRTSEENGRCRLSDAAFNRRDQIFPIRRGSGPAYIHFDLLYNAKGTGYMQVLSPIEDTIFKTFNELQNKWYDAGKVDTSELAVFYRNADFGLSL